MEKLTRHHSIAQSIGGSWDPANLVLLPWTQHRAKHILFGNDLPIEVIRTELEVAKTTLHGDVYNMINGVLRQVEGIQEAYNPKCYHGTRLKEYLTKK